MGSGVCPSLSYKASLLCTATKKSEKTRIGSFHSFSVLSWPDGHFMFLLHEHFHRSATTFHDVNALLRSVQATALHIVILSCGVV